MAPPRNDHDLTTPQFIAWLDGKMAGYDKLVPPGAVLAAELDSRVEAKIRAHITALILREAGLDGRTRLIEPAKLREGIG